MYSNNALDKEFPTHFHYYWCTFSIKYKHLRVCVCLCLLWAVLSMWHQNELLIKMDSAWCRYACMQSSLRSLCVFLHICMCCFWCSFLIIFPPRVSYAMHSKADKGNLLYLGPVDKAISLKTSTTLKMGSRYREQQVVWSWRGEMRRRKRKRESRKVRERKAEGR